MPLREGNRNEPSRRAVLRRMTETETMSRNRQYHRADPRGWPLWLRIIATVLALLVAAWTVLYVTKGRFLKSTFVEMASDRTGRAISVGGDFNLYLNVFDVQFLAEDMTIANPVWARDDNLFAAERIAARIDIWRLIFGGDVRFEYLDLVRADFGLERDARGRNSWTFRQTSDEPFRLPEIARAAITGTTLRYADAIFDLKTDIAVGDVAASETRVQDRIPFAGTGTSRGAPFRLSGALTSPNATIAGGRNALEARIDVGDTRIDVKGTLPGATILEGSDLTLTARGGNLNTAFSLLGLVVPDTRRYTITSKLTLVGEEWRFTRMQGRFGDSDLAGTMTISLPRDRLLVVADLTSRNLDILDAGPWIGYSPQRLDAMGGDGAIQTVAGRPRVLPDAPLAAEALGRFDAQVKYRAANVRTGTIPIKALEIDLGLDKKLLTLKPVAFDIAGGRLTADIALNARQSPVVTDYDVRLSPVGLGALLTGFDVENNGTTGTVKARVQLRGTGDTVRESLGSANGRIAAIFPKGTLWLRNAELVELDIGGFLQAAISDKLKKPADIRCGLVGLTVRNGVAVADPIFFDTARSVIRGRGSISLKDETLDLRIEADSKKFSLFSAQSPIGIDGYWAEPKIDPVSKELIRRGVVGAVAGIAVFPPAALISFIDPGEEKDTDCTPVLAGARTAAVRAADKAAEKR
jgi:hypothetical protein